jgi:nucleotide-binding universal stress UspA family protein
MNVLIVALDAVLPAGVSEAEVLVVAPAVNSRLRRWLSDEAEARRRAQQLAAAIVDLLARVGVDAEGRVGDADPLLAIADALATFPADEIVIAGRPERVSELDTLLARVRDRFTLPIRAADSRPMAA